MAAQSINNLLNQPDLFRAMQIYWKIAVNMKPDEFQLEDWMWLWDKLKAAILRSRGGSKTHDLTHWIVFRVLRTHEHWLWLACKGGQLSQARRYFEANPFVKSIKETKTSTFFVRLWSGDEIRCGIISTSNLGIRCDGILYDEFEDLQPKQQHEIYPQMFGMMTASSVHHEIYAGTRWLGTLYDEFCDTLPVRVRPWRECSWLVQAGAIQEEIDAQITPQWQIDLLYECIATSPTGRVFPNIFVLEKFSYNRADVNYGIDLGTKDMAVGTLIFPDKFVVVQEYEFQVEDDHSVFDFLRGNSVEVESGGYNEQDRYAAKCQLLTQRIGAVPMAPTNKWKSRRQLFGRTRPIYVLEAACPNIYKDLKAAVFDEKTGLYLKDRIHPNHYLDAFLHSIHEITEKMSTVKIETNLPSIGYSSNFGTIR